MLLRIYSGNVTVTALGTIAGMVRSELLLCGTVWENTGVFFTVKIR